MHHKFHGAKTVKETLHNQERESLEAGKQLLLLQITHSHLHLSRQKDLGGFSLMMNGNSFEMLSVFKYLAR